MPLRVAISATAITIGLLVASCGTAETDAHATTTVEVDGRFTLAGDVVIRNRDNLTLPEGARVLIRLADISVQDAADVLIAEATSTALTLPLRYELEWDADLDTGRDYSVSASVVSATGDLLFTSDTVHPFWPGDTDVTVELVAA